jgi:hypothetical protein
MPIIHQHTLKEHDVEYNSNVFYLFIENEKKKGGDYVSTMLRDVPNGLPITLKKSGGTGIDSYYDDDEYIPIIYALNVDLDNINGLLLHRAIVVIPDITFHNDHLNMEFFNRKCPKFYKHFTTRYHHLIKQFAPKKLPVWV